MSGGPAKTLEEAGFATRWSPASQNGEPVSGLPFCTSQTVSVQSQGLDAPTRHGTNLYFNSVQLIIECAPQSDPVLKLGEEGGVARRGAALRAKKMEKKVGVGAGEHRRHIRLGHSSRKADHRWEASF